MNQGEREHPVFHRFSELRGAKVFDRNGEAFGRLEDVFIHENEKALHYLDIRSGGFLGLGKRMFLVPLHLVDTIREEKITLNKSRQEVLDSPEVVPRRVLETHDRQAISRSFGGPGGYAGG